MTTGKPEVNDFYYGQILTETPVAMYTFNSAWYRKDAQAEILVLAAAVLHSKIGLMGTAATAARHPRECC